MRDLTQQALDTIKIIILASAVVLSVQYVFADWTGPTGNPPDGNPEPPVNVGGDFQSKTGDFAAVSLQAFAIAALGTDGVPDIQIGGTANGIKVLDGGLDVAGQGIFLGGVTANDGDDDVSVYLQADSDDLGGGLPISADCDAVGEVGRLITDIDNGNFYVCHNVFPSTIEWRKIKFEDQS